MSPPPRARPEDGGRRDAAFVLPLFGALLLAPPFLNLFAKRILLWGLPLEAVYLFGVWLALVLGALALSRRPPSPEEEEPAAEDEPGGGG